MKRAKSHSNKGKQVIFSLLLVLSAACIIFALAISPVSTVCTALAALAGIVINPFLINLLKKTRIRHTGIKCTVTFIMLAAVLAWLLPKEIEADKRLKEGIPVKEESSPAFTRIGGRP